MQPWGVSGWGRSWTPRAECEARAAMEERLEVTILVRGSSSGGGDSDTEEPHNKPAVRNKENAVTVLIGFKISTHATKDRLLKALRSCFVYHQVYKKMNQHIHRRCYNQGNIHIVNLMIP